MTSIGCGEFFSYFSSPLRCSLEESRFANTQVSYVPLERGRFYINSNTKESQWDRPVSPIASQPPSQREHVPHQETDRAGLDRSHLAARLASTQLEDEEEPPPSKDRVPNVPAGWIAKWSDQYQTWSVSSPPSACEPGRSLKC